VICLCAVVIRLIVGIASSPVMTLFIGFELLNL